MAARSLETHGDGSEFLLAFGLVALGGCAFLAALVQSVLGRRAFSAAVAMIAQVAVLYVLVQAEAHLDACMVAEGRNPPMRWSLPW